MPLGGSTAAALKMQSWATTTLLMLWIFRCLTEKWTNSHSLGAIRKQLAAFLEGFYEIIPKRLISIFTEQELELLISGLPAIDIDDLKANTEYHKYQSSSIQVGMRKCLQCF